MPPNSNSNREATAREVMLLRGLARVLRQASFESAIRRQRGDDLARALPPELPDTAIVVGPTLPNHPS